MIFGAGLIRLASLDVGREVDLVGQLGDVHLEPLLHLVQDLGVRLLGHEGDGQTLKCNFFLINSIG